ncbi:MAG: peptide-methionine (S)-S-oxide reductase MsrA [Acidobacteria bacterium]|nr:peptide-methionine (S)-S-oxide reductase MsrA [Acidobacteriota bacterium]
MNTEKATFAAGCFWGVEAVFRNVPGVTDVTVGYTGGSAIDPSYQEVCAGTTGHAEAILVTFDPETVSFEKLMEVFWESHDPTTLNRQGPDIGSQYRSAVFFHTPEQEKVAARSKEELSRSGRLARPIATEITPAGRFFPAEEYHQRYLEKRDKSNCKI